MNNVVYIETSKRSGSGVIFKCDYKDEVFDDIGKDTSEAYIVLTNYHVLQDLDCNEKEQKQYVDLEILDIDGAVVDSQYIKHVYFASGNNFDYSNDIAALLVLISSVCSIDCDNQVYFDYNADTSVTTIGYPHVFQDDEINHKLKLKGTLEECEQSKIEMYKIQDDYHWYQNTTDKDLLEGLSGGPVYAAYDNKSILIGINQSLCNIGEGKNPFKIVYFIPIRRVFEWLRSQGILIFEYVNHNVRIRWIENIKNRKSENEKSIVLIGNSGSGKTSFVKTFCLNSDNIDASGDGQTTRMNINYELKTFCEKPNIQITFRNKEKFAEYIMDINKYNIIDFVCRNRFGMMPRDLDFDKMAYIRDFSIVIEHLNLEGEFKGNIKKTIKKINAALFLSGNEKDLEVYDDIILKCYFEIFELLEKILKHSSDKNLKLCELRTLLNREYFNEYFNSAKNLKFNSIEKIDNFFDKGFKEVMPKSFDTVNDNELVDSFKTLINKCSGFFDIREFDFLFEEDELKNKCNDFFAELFLIPQKENEYNSEKILKKDWRSLERFQSVTSDNETNKTEKKNAKTLYGSIEEYYKKIYDLINEKLMAHIIDISQKVYFHFNELCEAEKKIITLCLKVENGSSLTSLVESICIEDSFSNDFAMLLNDKNIDHITFVDTYGLNHIERGNQLEVTVANVFNTISDSKEAGPDAVFYIKKMDSEKPTELGTILPIINGLRQTTPIYCIFTAADQFFMGKESHLPGLRWNKQNYDRLHDFRDFLFPKIVGYLLTNNTLVKRLKGPDKVKNKIYSVITDNLVPFTSKYDINNDTMLELNRKSIDIVFTSLLIDEWNNGFIDVKKWKEYGEGAQSQLKHAIQEDLKNMFSISSRDKWEFKHHKTIEANFRRLYRFNKRYDKNNPTLGFNGVEIGRWDNLLQIGYSEAFLGKNGQTLYELIKRGIQEEKAYSILAILKDIMLLQGMNVWEKRNENMIPKVKDENHKMQFRDLFEKMYSTGQYKNNPFDRKEEEIYIKEYSLRASRKRAEYLNDVCDFRKGIENKDILSQFVDYVYENLCIFVEKENERCLRLLIKYKQDFKKDIYDMIETIQKYFYGEEKDVKGALELLSNIEFNTTEN